MSNLRDDYRPQQPRDSVNSTVTENPRQPGSQGRHPTPSNSNPAVLPVSDRTPLLMNTMPSIESITQSQAGRQAGGQRIGRIRVTIGDGQSRHPGFNCSCEVIVNLFLLTLYCGLYGSLFAVPHVVKNVKDHILVMACVHAIQFIVIFAQYVRASVWASKLKGMGYLSFPHELSAFRKSTVFIFAFSATLVSVGLAWTRENCDPTQIEPCLIDLNESQLFEVYLAIECFAVICSLLAYIARFVYYRRSHSWPDVINEANLESLDLTGSAGRARSGGEPQAPILSITDELRIGEEFESMGDDVVENQSALIGYLKQRNFQLSQRLHELRTKLAAMEGNEGLPVV